MLKHYFKVFYFSIYFMGLVISSQAILAQETKIFTTEDYDLVGHVKSCLVLTDYGREEFEFDKAGLLTKSVTRYDDKNYNITYYKYNNGYITERRDEVYRDGKFEENSSIAHFFELDTLQQKKITERIVAYNKEFLDRYEYFFDEGDQLIRIVRSSNEGVDETMVEYSEQKGEATTAYFLNEVLLKTIRESTSKGKDGKEHRIVLTKEYIKGSPDKALEQIFTSSGNLQSEVQYDYSKTEKSFVPVSNSSYEYEEHNKLSSIQKKANGQTATSNYVYQFDINGNWIKKVITPGNAYTTRRIIYYPEEPVDENNE